MSVREKLDELRARGEEVKAAFTTFLSVPTPENGRAVTRLTEEVVFLYQQLNQEVRTAKATGEWDSADVCLQVRVKCSVCRGKFPMSLESWLAAPAVFCSGECEKRMPKP